MCLACESCAASCHSWLSWSLHRTFSISSRLWKVPGLKYLTASSSPAPIPGLRQLPRQHARSVRHMIVGLLACHPHAEAEMPNSSPC